MTYVRKNPMRFDDCRLSIVCDKVLGFTRVSAKSGGTKHCKTLDICEISGEHPFNPTYEPMSRNG